MCVFVVNIPALKLPREREREMFVHMVFIENENTETNLFPGNLVLGDGFLVPSNCSVCLFPVHSLTPIRTADNTVSDTEPLGSAG